jgi:hypothetical protein
MHDLKLDPFDPIKKRTIVPFGRQEGLGMETARVVMYIYLIMS